MRIVVLKSQWKPIGPRYTGLIQGHLSYKGSLQLLLNRHTSRDDFEFRKIGPYFYAENDNFVSIYKHEPGTTQGFAGRKITLSMEDGTSRTFHGSLWDPTTHSDMSEVPEYRAVSITDDPKVMERGFTFFAAYVTKIYYEQLLGDLEAEREVGNENNAVD